MKLLKYIFSLLLVVTLISCSSDDDDTIDPINEVEGLMMIQELSNDTHTIEMYSVSGELSQGYNDITIRLKDKTNQSTLSKIF
jgi:hypothetical protein